MAEPSFKNDRRSHGRELEWLGPLALAQPDRLDDGRDD